LFEDLPFPEGIVLQGDNRVTFMSYEADPWPDVGRILRFHQRNADNSFAGTISHDFQWFNLPRDAILQTVGGAEKILVAFFTDERIYHDPENPENDIVNNDLAVVRLNSNLTLDTSFGTNGFALVNAGVTELLDSAKAIDFQGQNIIVVGDDSPGPEGIIPRGKKIHLTRLNPSGAVDTSFGTNGVVSHTFANDVEIFEMAVQPDGKILVVGEIVEEGTDGIFRQNFLLVRYKADGSLDTTFNSGSATPGIIKGAIHSESSGRYVIVQPDGKILVRERGLIYGIIRRFNPNGTPDYTFGDSDGMGGRKGYFTLAYTYIPTLTYEYLASLHLLPDGRMVVGSHHCYQDDDADDVFCTIHIILLKANGTLDNSLNGKGWFSFDSPISIDYMHTEILSDGRILVTTGNYDDGFMVRLPISTTPNIYLPVILR
jgi:uncharacterized delta-60 repeat protein